MQKRVVLVSAAAAVLGLAVAVLGFVSERARFKALVGYDGQRCVYRRTAAFGCGIAAAVLVLAGMAIATAASGCFGRRSAPGGSGRRSTAVKLSTIAWALVVAATVMFLYGAWRNSGGTSGVSRFRGGQRFNRTYYYYGCAVVRGGIFATASIASAVATACAVAAYVNLHKQDEEGQYGEPGGGVAMMGQPQWSQPSYPPPPSQFAGPGVAMGQPTQWAQPYPAAYPPPAGYPAPPPHHGYGAGGYAGKPPAGTA
ncbi:hypothetical protein EJB05_55533, partial [Eragrostis curvula]